MRTTADPRKGKRRLSRMSRNGKAVSCTFSGERDEDLNRLTLALSAHTADWVE
jgi:sirohydrochlorin ferrochelatase